MGKTRVHLLAKELGIETKELIAHLEKMGIRGRKAQSALDDDEVSRVRSALAAEEKPQVHVGEEKVVADRVVTAEDQAQGEIQARETVVERRVRANVIRRRVSRVEVPQAESKPTEESPIESAEEVHAAEASAASEPAAVTPPEPPTIEELSAMIPESTPELPAESLPEPLPE